MGFPCLFCCRCWLSGAKAGAKEEAEENYLRTKTQPGKIIGRPAGRDAYKGQSGMKYERKPDTRRDKEPTKDHQIDDGSPTKPTDDATPSTADQATSQT